MKSDPSPICSQVRKAIQEKDEFEGNYRFCNLDIVRKHTFKHELGFLFGSTSSHRKLCERWLLENSLEIDRHFG